MEKKSKTEKSKNRTTQNPTEPRLSGNHRHPRPPYSRKALDYYKSNDIKGTVSNYNDFLVDMEKKKYPHAPSKFYNKHVMFRPPVAGGFGVVVFLQNIKHPSLLLAVKIVQDCPRHESELYWMWLFRESGSFVKLISVFTDAREPGPPAAWTTIDSKESVWSWPRQLYIVTEYYPYSLFDVLSLSNTFAIRENSISRATAIIPSTKHSHKGVLNNSNNGKVLSSKETSQKKKTKKKTKGRNDNSESDKSDSDDDEDDDSDDDNLSSSESSEDKVDSFEKYTQYKSDEDDNDSDEDESAEEIRPKHSTTKRTLLSTSRLVTSPTKEEQEQRRHHSHAKQSGTVTSKNHTQLIIHGASRRTSSDARSKILSPEKAQRLIEIKNEYQKMQELYKRIYNQNDWPLPATMRFVINDEEMVQFAFELFYAVYTGRCKLSFFDHLDMSMRNITFKITNTQRNYPIKDKIVAITSKYKPVFIDFGVSQGPWTPRTDILLPDPPPLSREDFGIVPQKKRRNIRVDFINLCKVLLRLITQYQKKGILLKHTTKLYNVILDFWMRYPGVSHGSDTNLLEDLLSHSAFDINSPTALIDSTRKLSASEQQHSLPAPLRHHSFTKLELDKTEEDTITTSMFSQATIAARQRDYLAKLNLPTAAKETTDAIGLVEKAQALLLEPEYLTRQQLVAAVSRTKAEVKKAGMSIILEDDFA